VSSYVARESSKHPGEHKCRLRAPAGRRRPLSEPAGRPRDQHSGPGPAASDHTAGNARPGAV